MTASTVTPLDALQRLLDASKLLDFADCKDERVWQALGAAQGTAEGVLRDYVEPAPVAYHIKYEDFRHFSGATATGRDFVQAQPLDLTCRYFEGCESLVVTPLYATPVAQPAKTEGCAGFQGKPVSDCGPCAGEGCDGAVAASVPELSHAQLADVWDSLPGRFLVDFGYQQFAVGVFEKQREMLAAAPAIAAPTEVERDAARYRWLRESSVGQWAHPIVVEQLRDQKFGRINYIGPLSGCALDAAIDAAIATGEKK